MGTTAHEDALNCAALSRDALTPQARRVIASDIQSRAKIILSNLNALKAERIDRIGGLTPIGALPEFEDMLAQVQHLAELADAFHTLR